VQSGAGVVAHRRTVALQIALDVSAEQPDCARPASADSLELAPEEDILVDLEAASVQSRAAVIAHACARAGQLPSNVSMDQPDGAKLPSADSLEPVGEEGALVDLQAVGGEGGAGIVVHRRVRAVQYGEVGAEQPDCAVVAVSRDHRSIESQHGSREVVGIQRRLGRVVEPASRQDEKRQLRTARQQALAQQAVIEFHGDVSGQVVEVELAGNAGAAQLQPTWVRVGGQPSAQDVAEHGRPNGPGTVPAPHRRLVNCLGSGKVEQLPAGDVVDQRPLDVRQGHSAGDLCDHAVTIGANGLDRNASGAAGSVCSNTSPWTLK
jgi:hypothetical protein